MSDILVLLAFALLVSSRRQAGAPIDSGGATRPRTAVSDSLRPPISGHRPLGLPDGQGTSLTTLRERLAGGSKPSEDASAPPEVQIATIYVRKGRLVMRRRKGAA